MDFCQQNNLWFLICCLGWSWNSNSLATSCEELTHWKRLWCWEGSGAGEEGDDRGWDGWMTSLTRWTWVWVNSGSWWWTGRPGALQFMGSQRVGHDWATELNWTESTVEPKNKPTHCSEPWKMELRDTLCFKKMSVGLTGSLIEILHLKHLES